MDRRKDRASLLSCSQRNLEDGAALLRRDFRIATIGELRCYSISRMNFYARFRRMGAETWTCSRPRHCMPMIAQASGIQAKRKAVRGRGVWLGRLWCDEASTTIACEKAPRGKKAPVTRRRSNGCGPHYGIEGVIRLVGERRERTDIEVAFAVIFECRERSVLAKDVCRSAVIKCVAKIEPPRDLADDPPVGPSFAGQGQECPLTRDAPFRISHRAVLFAPCSSRQKDLRTGLDCVVSENVVGDYEQIEVFQGGAHHASPWHGDRGVGPHDP